MDYKSLPASADQARKCVFYTTCCCFTIILQVLLILEVLLILGIKNSEFVILLQ